MCIASVDLPVNQEGMKTAWICERRSMLSRQTERQIEATRWQQLIHLTAEASSAVTYHYNNHRKVSSVNKPGPVNSNVTALQMSTREAG